MKIETIAIRPCLRVQVVEEGAKAQEGWVRCELNYHIKFTLDKLKTYFFAKWEPLAYDALVLTAAVEFVDRARKRPALTWSRELHLNVPVHDPDLWNAKSVNDALVSALTFLTGDSWQIEFTRRATKMEPIQQSNLELGGGIQAVVPFSNGMDSLAVSSLLAAKLGGSLVRIRVGSSVDQKLDRKAKRQPFASVPYEVTGKGLPFSESTARSRGFKFAFICAIASFLAKSERIIVTESGQGIFGPALLGVGQAHDDYRNHPLFLRRMEAFVVAVTGHRVTYEFPRIWSTKGQTLKEYIAECSDDARWAKTWSCWQGSRQSSVNGKKRQCGICAACLLRRVSVHAADQNEDPSRFVWENLSAPTFNEGASSDFAISRITPAMREYAIAGARHLEDMATLAEPTAYAHIFNRSTSQLSLALGLEKTELASRTVHLFKQHASEWAAFKKILGNDSFMMQWVSTHNE